MIRLTKDGDFAKTSSFFRKMLAVASPDSLDKYGQMGVDALMASTPVDTGKTAQSWSYEIHRTKTGVSIYWVNTNINKGVNIAIILQYGHGLHGGGYVKGVDYINPALQPVFDEISKSVAKEVELS